LKADSWRQSELGAKPTRLWQEAVVKWLLEQSHKRSIETDKHHLRWLRQHLDGTPLDKIDRPMLDQIAEAKKSEGSSNATCNRILSLIRAIINRAKDEWEWIEAAPAFRFLPEPKERIRWLSKDEAERLLAVLPAHLSAMARFALATGLRESNVTGLQWRQVDLQRRCAWIDAHQAKAGKAIAVPLSHDAIQVLMDQADRHPDYVFTYEGKPVSKAGGNAWRKALARAGIENFRWHDLRHTWASWHVQAGTPINVLRELGGWSDLDMVLRYAHLSSDHLQAHADNSSMRGNVIELGSYRKVG
jgi:integrase